MAKSEKVMVRLGEGVPEVLKTIAPTHQDALERISTEILAPSPETPFPIKELVKAYEKLGRDANVLEEIAGIVAGETVGLGGNDREMIKVTVEKLNEAIDVYRESSGTPDDRMEAVSKHFGAD